MQRLSMDEISFKGPWLVGSCQNCLGHGLLRVSMKDNECEYSVILRCVESRRSFEKPVVK